MRRGFLRIVRRAEVEMLDDNGQPALPAIDPVKVLQNLAPAEGVAAFLAVQNLMAQTSQNEPVTVWTSAIVGLLVSLVVTWLGLSPTKQGSATQWVVFWCRITAYLLFSVMLAKAAGVEILPFQGIIGPAALVLFAFLAPPIIARLEKRL